MNKNLRLRILMITLIIITTVFVAVFSIGDIKYIKTLNDTRPLLLMWIPVVGLILNYFLRYSDGKFRYEKLYMVSNWLVWAIVGGFILVLAALYFAVLSGIMTLN